MGDKTDKTVVCFSRLRMVLMTSDHVISGWLNQRRKQLFVYLLPKTNFLADCFAEITYSDIVNFVLNHRPTERPFSAGTRVGHVRAKYSYNVLLRCGRTDDVAAT